MTTIRLQIKKLYFENKIFRIVINSSVGGIIIGLIFPAIFNYYINDINKVVDNAKNIIGNYNDKNDTRQYFKVDIINEKEYSFNKCDEIKINIKTDSLIDVRINVEYRADKEEEGKTTVLSSVYPEIYTLKKPSLPQPSGVNFYEVVAFKKEQSCKFQSGSYVVVLYYDYIYRTTLRSYSTKTKIFIK